MSNYRPLGDIIADLSQRFPDYEEQRKQGGAQLTYLSWHHANQLLDIYAPGWQGRVESLSFSGDRIFVVYSITIPTAEGPITRTSTGTEVLKEIGRDGTEKEMAYGDPSSNAESMAFRRAAARFGLGLYLYLKTDAVSASQPARKPTPSAPPPVAETPRKVITPKTSVTPKSSSPSTQPAVSNEEEGARILDLQVETSGLLKRLKWSTDQGKAFLKQAYGKETRAKLTLDEYEDFRNQLELKLQEAA